MDISDGFSVQERKTLSQPASCERLARLSDLHKMTGAKITDRVYTMVQNVLKRDYQIVVIQFTVTRLMSKCHSRQGRY